MKPFTVDIDKKTWLLTPFLEQRRNAYGKEYRFKVSRNEKEFILQNLTVNAELHDDLIRLSMSEKEVKDFIKKSVIFELEKLL